MKAGLFGEVYTLSGTVLASEYSECYRISRKLVLELFGLMARIGIVVSIVFSKITYDIILWAPGGSRIYNLLEKKIVETLRSSLQICARFFAFADINHLACHILSNRILLTNEASVVTLPGAFTLDPGPDSDRILVVDIDIFQRVCDVISMTSRMFEANWYLGFPSNTKKGRPFILLLNMDSKTGSLFVYVLSISLCVLSLVMNSLSSAKLDRLPLLLHKPAKKSVRLSIEEVSR
jgi:hypothetical protein